jgi:predicted metalloendopeptidase
MKRSAARGLLAAALAALNLPAQAALDVAGLDKSIDACTDLYQYANKSWLASTEIPADRASWGTFQVIAQHNEEVLFGILDEGMKELSGKKYKHGSPEWMAFNYYRSGMDQNRIEYWSFSQIRPLLDIGAAVKTPADIASALGALHAQGIGAGFAFEVEADRKDSSHYLAQFVQGGLGLPDRDYYFLDDERSKKAREGYVKHMQKMFVLLQDTPEQAQRDAQTVFALETELARASMTSTERRDVDKTYNKMTQAQLAALAPQLPWKSYFTALGAAGEPEVNVQQPEFLKALARLAAERPQDFQAYLRWHVVHAAAPTLPRTFEKEDFDFYERQLKGVKDPPPRKRKVLRIIGGRYGEEGVGMALGKLFAEATFPPEAKARSLALVNNVKAALLERLKAATWMTEETRRRSLEKLAGIDVKIGYPDKWRDYTGSEIGPGNFVENWLAASRFDQAREVARIGKEVDRREWLMAPYIVNAYYNPAVNEIVFPAAILQPPYFDVKADDPLNYGGIGMIIGHEITHGFDDRGRRFDKNGNMTDWWTEEDGKRYNARAEIIERQYSAMEPVDGVHPNGKLTLGENISDIGGLKIAYDALQIALKGKPRAKVEGFTPEQRFFIAWAQAWRDMTRPEQERQYLLADGHSLSRLRVRGPVAHMPEFAKAFSCDASKTLLPDLKGNAIW